MSHTVVRPSWPATPTFANCVIVVNNLWHSRISGALKIVLHNIHYMNDSRLKLNDKTSFLITGTQRQRDKIKNVFFYSSASLGGLLQF